MGLPSASSWLNTPTETVTMEEKGEGAQAEALGPGRHEGLSGRGGSSWCTQREGQDTGERCVTDTQGEELRGRGSVGSGSAAHQEPK